MKKIKVILLKDIDNLGRRYDIKVVKLGYARNFLLPKGLVKIATKENLKWLERELEKISEKEEKELQKFQEIASKIDGLEVVFELRVGENDELFESVTASKISKKLKEMGFDVTKDQILLPKPIKSLGEFPVKIKLPHNLEPEIKIIINPKEE